MGKRSLARATMAVLLLAGCTDTDDAATPGTAAPPDPTTATTTSVPLTTSSSTSTSTSTSTTSSTSTTTTTTVPGTATVAATCATLRTAAWPDRRGVILVNTAAYEAEGGVGPLVDPVRATCPDDLARQEAAAALAQRMSTLLDGFETDPADIFTASACVGTDVFTTYTNHHTEPIGLIVGARAIGVGVDVEPVDSAQVVWSMAPAQAPLLTIPMLTDDDSCGWTTHFFLAEPGLVDAAIPGGPGPATTGDDPAVWLPAFEQSWTAWFAAPSEALAKDVVDARMLRRTDQASEPHPDVHPLASATVCAGTVDQPDADHIAFAYRTEYAPHTVDGQEHPGYAYLSYGAFRRGSDGRWRLLSDPMQLNGSLMGADCGPIVAHS